MIRYQSRLTERWRSVCDADQCLISRPGPGHHCTEDLSSVVLYQGYPGTSTIKDTEASFYTMEKRLGSQSITQFANDAGIRHELKNILKKYQGILKSPSTAILNECRLSKTCLELNVFQVR